MRLKHKSREIILQECLESIQMDGETIDSELSRHPEDARALRAELEAAEWLRARRAAFDPRPGFIAASRRRLLAAIQDGSAPAGPNVRGLKWDPLSLFGRRTTYARLLLALLLVMVSLYNVGRLAQTSHTWLPGDRLYPLKTAMETAELLATVGAAGDAHLHIQLAQQRLLEIQSLVFETRFERIPPTVVNFAIHVDKAVRAIDRVAERDPDQARLLAAELQAVLSNQTSLVILLAGYAPPESQLEFEMVRLVSESGISAVRDLFLLESSGV